MGRKAAVLVLLAGMSGFGQQKIAAVVDAGKTGEPIEKYVYGQFIEQGGTINKALSAEMLDDRKFFYDVNSNPQDPTPPWGQVPRPQRWNHWRPIGADEFVVMDRRSEERRVGNKG